MQKTNLNLSKDQLQSIINDFISQENGVNELFKTIVNGLMYLERKEFLDNDLNNNKANGFRKILKAGIGSGLELCIPRDRLSLFKPLILAMVDQQEEKIKDLSFALYGKGLTTREISDILHGIYGSGYSKSSISNISKEFYGFFESWLTRSLDDYYPIVFIDALYLKVRRGSTVSTEAFYVVLGLKEDFTREIISIENIPTESAIGWSEVLNNLKTRGLKHVGLFVSDDLKGLDSSISLNYPSSSHQKCVLHFTRNILKHIRIQDRVLFCEGLKKQFEIEEGEENKEKLVRKLKIFLTSWLSSYPTLKKVIKREDLSLLFTYKTYDKRIRRMIYTTNWIERFNKSVKRTTKIRNSLPSPKSALMLICYKALEQEEKSFKYILYNFKYERSLMKHEFMENLKTK